MSLITNIGDATAELFQKDTFKGRKLVINGGSDISNMDDAIDTDKKKGFGGEASSARWTIPRGWGLVLYEDHDYQGQSYPLVGWGARDESHDLSGFNDDCSSARWERVAENHTFVTGYTPEYRNIIREQHRRAYDSIFECKSLLISQKSMLIKKYWEEILHKITTKSDRLGEARINSKSLSINFDLCMKPNDPNLVAIVLIHEMMHCAGFVHPDRTDEDEFGDGGPYYGSPPPKAEECVLSQITLKNYWLNLRCRNIDGQCAIGAIS